MVTPVNSMITDSVCQTNLQVLGSAPAMAMGSLYQTHAHSAGILAQNCVQAQQQASISALAATNMGIQQVYNASTMAGAAATGKVAQSSSVTELLTLVIALKALKIL